MDADKTELTNMLLKKPVLYFIFLFSLLSYFVLAYHTPRQYFMQLIGLFAISFFCYIYFIYFNKKTSLNFYHLLIFGIAFRLVFLLATPLLSNDYYRFIWDGELILHRINPFRYAPSEIINDIAIQNINISKDLFLGMGQLSQGNYSCYPPVNQIFFFISTLFSNNNMMGNIVIMRLFIILSEIGIVFFGIRLLKRLNLPKSHILLYILNPLVIVELTGNLHFEAIMIFFLAIALYLLFTQKGYLSAIIFSLSVSIKLIPLILLPVFFKKLKWKESVKYYFIVGIITVIFFVPLINSGTGNNFFSSISLYFHTFEFNASIYYLVRGLGYLFVGYNIIGVAGIILSIMTFTAIIIIALRKRNTSFEGIFVSMLFVFFIYYTLATTVHPWYITPLIFITIFTRYRFAIVWSFMIIFSYYAYSNDLFKENLFLVFIEYLVVFAYLIFELARPKSDFIKHFKPSI